VAAALSNEDRAWLGTCEALRERRRHADGAGLRGHWRGQNRAKTPRLTPNNP